MNADAGSAGIGGPLIAARLSGRVGVTGAGGFIGSHLVARALAENAQVRCLRDINSRSTAPPGLEVRSCDLSDAKSMTAALQDVSVIFHVGGLASIDAARESPEAAFARIPRQLKTF